MSTTSQRSQRPVRVADDVVYEVIKANFKFKIVFKFIFFFLHKNIFFLNVLFEKCFLL